MSVTLRARNSRIYRILTLLVLGSAALAVAATAQAEPHKAPAKQVTASTNLVRYLEAEGVTKVFGVPGEETLHIVDALRRSNKIKFVLAGNEQGASMMASGYSRATGKMGVALSTLGPGATNLVTGAVNAMSENIKLLLITGQGPVKRPLGYHQKMDLTQLFKPVTRLSLEAKTPGAVLGAARKLVKAANNNPGPVHLSLPSDVAAGQVRSQQPRRVPMTRRPRPTAKGVAAAAKLLKGAKFPVIVAGDGVLQERPNLTARAVLAFAKAHNIPVVPSAIAKGMFPWSNSQVLPPLDAFAKGKGADVVRKADLIISLGYHPTETFEPQNYNPKGRTKVLHISNQRLPKAHRIPGMDPKVELTTNLIKGLGAIHRQVRGYRAPDAAIKAAAKVRKIHGQELKQAAANPGSAAGMNPRHVMQQLRKALDAAGGKAMVFGDVGLNKAYLTQYLQVNRPGEVFVPNGMSTMGVSLPSAVGAKLARPDVKVMSVSGDGGLMMNVQELGSAARSGAGMVHVVLIDRKLGLIKNHQHRNGLQPSGVDVPALNIKALAKGMGARGVVLSRPDQIARVISRGLRGKRPLLVGIPVDYSEAHAKAKSAAPKVKQPRVRTPTRTASRKLVRVGSRSAGRRSPGVRRRR